MNRSKAPLALMGLLLVVLFFAVSAAICLQTFAKSELISETSENRDHASRACQNAAEALICTNGDLTKTASILQGNASDGALTVFYDRNWTNASDGIYILTAKPIESGEEGLGKGTITVTDRTDGTLLFFLECAWQEGLE